MSSESVMHMRIVLAFVPPSISCIVFCDCMLYDRSCEQSMALTSSPVRDVVISHGKDLVAFIEPSKLLLQSLLQCGIISQNHCNEVHTLKKMFNRNMKLLDILKTCDCTCDSLIEALVSAGQQHVAKFIQNNGFVGMSCLIYT